MNSAIIEKFCKWRSVFASWQLGTRSSSDPESQAVRDHRETTMLLRAENNALVALLIQKKVFSQVEFTAQLEVEAEHLDGLYEKKFPGFSTTSEGITMKMPEVLQTMANWRP